MDRSAKRLSPDRIRDMAVRTVRWNLEFYLARPCIACVSRA